MKALKKQFPKLLKTVLVLTLVLSFSCGDKDDGPEEPTGTVYVTLPDTVLGAYLGALTYQSSSATLPIENTSGTATIVSTGNKTYKITFSDDVPELTGFKFISSNGNFVSSSAGSSSEGVSINGSTELSVGVTKSGNNWGFSGDN